MSGVFVLSSITFGLSTEGVSINQLNITHFNSILYCAIFATVLTIYLQTRLQKFVSATKASIIYSAEPLFAALFGYLMLREIMKG